MQDEAVVTPRGVVDTASTRIPCMSPIRRGDLEYKLGAMAEKEVRGEEKTVPVLP